jgi:hypothetical protein
MGLLRILKLLIRSRLLRRALRLMIRLVRYVGWRRVARAALQLSGRRRPAGRARFGPTWARWR